MAEVGPKSPNWTFLTNHSHVLWCLYRQPDIVLREVAVQVGITERMVQKVLTELVASGYVTISKSGRRNHYQLHPEKPLRHPLESHCHVGAILQLLSELPDPLRKGR